MTISCNWLAEYLPLTLSAEKLALILNSIGLEVEGVENFEEIKGNLDGLVIGEVLEVSKHPNADKLSLTKVRTTPGTELQIVCGAPNVAVGQKVVVAQVGTTIYPLKGDPLTMKNAKIRGVESQGMICAEDEIGIGESHAGILVLPSELEPGTAAKDFFKPYSDTVIHIGLTPNRSDAMSHMGVARDVCAWLNHHENGNYEVVKPSITELTPLSNTVSVNVSVENTADCPRYSGIGFSSFHSGASPQWMQQRLKAIGVRPISSIVDITNYVLHETGQPLHAFDADKISGSKIIVKNLPEGTEFVSLDQKIRKLSAEDLMICDGDSNGMCIGGVFGGLNSGISNSTTKIFLESAWFNPVSIRKSSFRHNLRTDAALRFEKGVDIGNTVEVLKRTAFLLQTICGAEIASSLTDIYPAPKSKETIHFTYAYLKKISGKNYSADAVRRILESLKFEIIESGETGIRVSVPLHKTDVSLPADIAEEIMRIDGFDNIAIPQTITIAPSIESAALSMLTKEKTAAVLSGLGFNEILNNSIANSAWYTDDELTNSVKMMNNLSADLNILRPSILETGLQTVAHNLNRKNNHLRLFEFGKTYGTSAKAVYYEVEHLLLMVSGQLEDKTWKAPSSAADLYYLKGIIQALATHSGLDSVQFIPVGNGNADQLNGFIGKTQVLTLGAVERSRLQMFDIRQDVYYADVLWEKWLSIASAVKIKFREISKFPAVNRDLAFVVQKDLPYQSIEKTARSLSIKKLKEIRLFDLFESDKLGKDKKSMAMNFVFQDDEKTLTDQEVEQFMAKIIGIFEKELSAQIRR
ncbi:phenylalanine--tRNA ligase subunit beta [Pollutibacter soli]|uniref:phenylalanine--tRNA ligase subunit beta n=1 Tax=Pollutibacter soli TaxID=3034157 RepID=UPI0030136A4B